MDYRTARSLKKGDRVVLRLENVSKMSRTKDGAGRGNTLESRRQFKKDILEDGFINHHVYVVHNVRRERPGVYRIDVEMNGASAYHYKYQTLGAFFFERA